jgi:hyaluronan synthase
MNQQKIITFMYYLSVIITLSTIIPPLLYLIGYKTLFFYYIIFYSSCIIFYTWYRFIGLSYLDFKKNRWGTDLTSRFTVVIPCYNEGPDLLIKCVESVIEAEGNKDIMIIDDGSKNNIWKTILDLKKKYDFIYIHKFEQNLGKREALFYAFNNIDNEFIITIDSDTVVEKDAFIYLLGPFKDAHTGATTGNIRLINEKKNWLTRVTAGMYLSGINNYKQSQSVLGNVTCCSGCLSAYRNSIIKDGIAEKFINQMFLGKKAVHSEDRHLTNLILEKDYRVYYVKESLCYTESPDTLKVFLKQQQRWKRGFFREGIYLLSFSPKVSKTLFLEALLGNMVPFFMTVGIEFALLFMLLVSPLYVLLYIVPGWILFLTIREMPIFVEEPKRAVWYYFYIPLYELILFWQNLYAIFTVDNKDWMTRKIEPTERVFIEEELELPPPIYITVANN